MHDSSVTGRDDFREFYERVGERYPEERLVYRTLRGIVRRQFVLAQLKSFQGRMLDLGCNRGFYLSVYERGPGVGIDIAFSVLRAAKRLAPRACFIQGDAQDLSFLRSSSFDVILCSEVIEHVMRPECLMSECSRVLKPGGVLLITTPNYRKCKPTWIDVGEMAHYGVNGVKDKTHYFHTAFRPAELQSLAENCGLQILEVGTFEKEVKYATRIPVLFYHCVRLLNRLTVRSGSLERVNGKLLESASLVVYRLCNALGLNGLLVKSIDEGTRSFLLAGKDDYGPGHGENENR